MTVLSFCLRGGGSTQLGKTLNVCPLMVYDKPVAHDLPHGPGVGVEIRCTGDAK